MLLIHCLKQKLQFRWETIKQKSKKPNKNAIWVFGMQKAGTSAIASLLAYRTGKSSTIDTPFLWQPYLFQLKNDELNFITHIKNNPLPFSKEIIKEPNASLLISDIKTYFRLEKFIFIYRNPYHVIRSILNRLNLQGNEKNLNINKIDENWRHLFGNGDNYVEKLAFLWLEIYSQFSVIESKNCVLIKYEDFMNDKLKSIDLLCQELNLKPLNNIDAKLNVNFQPRGDNQVDLKLFFGNENYEVITRITGDIRAYYED